MSFIRLISSLALGPPLLVLAASCALGSAAGWAGWISPFWDMFAHLAPIWVAGGLAGLVGGLAFTGWVRRPLIVAGAAAIALSAGLMAPEYIRDAGPRAPADAPRQLKLIQINVWSVSNRDLRATAAWIAAQKPDIVTANESDSRFRDLLVRAGGFHVACPHCDNMVFSRRPPVSTETPRRPDNESGAPFARASFRDDRGDYTIIATHSGWPAPDGLQQYETGVVAQLLDGFRKSDLIVAGDLNSTPWSWTRRRADRRFGLIRRTRGLYTWPARPALPFPLLPIDHVYAGQNWGTVKVERGPRLGSDHYPVVVVLARRPAPS